jgi:glutamyl-tRNA synthetase
MFGGGSVETHLNGGAAPNAFIAIAFQNEGHAFAPVELALMLAYGAILTGHKRQNMGVIAVNVRGRFAPSPTGELHLGNLRTAVVAHHLAVEVGGGTFVVRMEDLDRVTSSPQWASEQLADLAAVGVESHVGVVFQSNRFPLYIEEMERLTARGLTYECFCTRKEIREAASAPHGEVNSYPGTCRELSEAQCAAWRGAGRVPAVRLRASAEAREKGADDVVLQRNDGVPAYNLAVVVDDAAQGITQVVRGADLLSVTPSQVHLQELLGLPAVEHVHVPLVVDAHGERLAKRHGNDARVNLRYCAELGFSGHDVRVALLNSWQQGSNSWGAASNVATWLMSLL